MVYIGNANFVLIKNKIIMILKIEVKKKKIFY